MNFFLFCRGPQIANQWWKVNLSPKINSYKTTPSALYISVTFTASKHSIHPLKVTHFRRRKMRIIHLVFLVDPYLKFRRDVKADRGDFRVNARALVWLLVFHRDVWFFELRCDESRSKRCLTAPRAPHLGWLGNLNEFASIMQALDECTAQNLTSRVWNLNSRVLLSTFFFCELWVEPTPFFSQHFFLMTQKMWTFQI